MFVLQCFQRFGVCCHGNIVRAKQADNSPEVVGFQFAGDCYSQACVLITSSLVTTLVFVSGVAEVGGVSDSGEDVAKCCCTLRLLGPCSSAFFI